MAARFVIKNSSDGQFMFVLKAGNTFVVNDANGDIRGNDDGLFVNDTRVLSQLRLTFGGRSPSLLSGSVSSDSTAPDSEHARA